MGRWGVTDGVDGQLPAGFLTYIMGASMQGQLAASLGRDLLNCFLETPPGWVSWGLFNLSPAF
jgi:hypothetical protein